MLCSLQNNTNSRIPLYWGKGQCLWEGQEMWMKRLRNCTECCLSVLRLLFSLSSSHFSHHSNSTSDTGLKVNKQTCIVLYANPPRSHGCCWSCSDTWAGEHKPLGQLTGGMPEWQIKYKINPHVAFLLHRCVQGLFFCHTSHLRQSLKSLSLFFCFLVYMK